MFEFFRIGKFDGVLKTLIFTLGFLSLLNIALTALSPNHNAGADDIAATPEGRSLVLDILQAIKEQQEMYES